MTHRICLFVVACLLSLSGSGQTLEEALTSPATITELSLNCATDDCDRFFDNIRAFTNLRILSVAYLQDEAPLRQLEKSFVRDLTISFSPGLNLNTVSKRLSNCRALRTLQLPNNKLTTLPRGISRLEQVEHLSFANNQLDIAQAVSRINSLPRLKSLDVSSNQLNDLPSSLTELTQLQKLDVSQNNLTDLPSTLGNLRYLNALDISQNLLIDPTASLEPVRSPRLLELQVDEVRLTEQKRKRLLELFPAADIDFKTSGRLSELPGPEDESATSDKKNETTDSTKSANADLVITNPVTPQTTSIDSLRFGQLNIGQKKLKAHSTAYVHYAKMMNNERFQYTFDTLLFEARYQDSTYSNVWKITAGSSFDNIALQMAKKPAKGEIWFKFRRTTKWCFIFAGSPALGTYLRRNHPEERAYSDMVWVYDEGFDKKAFKKNFIKNKFWTDFRLYYDDAAKTFTMEFKSLDGTTSIKAHPRLPNRDKPEDMSTKTYPQRHIRYMRTLDRRKKSFHRSLARNKQRYEKQLLKSQNAAWADFRKFHMSDAELKMSREEWMAYYETVLADEKVAMYNAPASAVNFEHSLFLSNYKTGTLGAEILDYAKLQQVEAQFQDEGGNLLVVQNICVIEPNIKHMYAQKGSKSTMPATLYLDLATETCVVLELLNGDMAIVPASEFKKAGLAEHPDHVFTARRFDRKLTHVGLLREHLNL